MVRFQDMTSAWSSEGTVAEQHGLQADTMALDYDGNVVFLAGRRHIAVRRLSDADVFEKMPRNHKYDATNAEWNPIPGYRQICAFTTNERVDRVIVREGGFDSLAPLKHHTRQVTDLNWHRLEPHQLATASADSSTLVWDTRDTRRPAVTFSAVAGVNHVRWNKLSSYLLATAHDGDLRLWDERKGTSPVQYIVAHSGKVHGIDWSQTHEYQLASCSQDFTVKLFDVMNPRRAETIMHTTAPVWRVRYTPWGEGLVTAIIPSATVESNLLLWNLSSHSGPVHTFVGPLDLVLEVHWRREGGDYQLLTWSKDQNLRVWRIEPFLQRLCGYTDADARADSDSDAGRTNSDVDPEIAGLTALDTGLPALETFNLSFGESNGAHLMDRGTIRTLEEEFEMLELNPNVPSVTCESIDVSNRSCVVRVSVNSHQVTLLVSFPPSYPYNAAPSFQIEDTSLVDPILKSKLLKILKQTAQQRVRKNRTCLDSCLAQVVSTLELTAQLSEERQPATRAALGTSPATRATDPTSVYSSFHDAYIPYPRSCGARFCSVGTLVYFCRPARVSARPELATPRSLTAATTLSFGGSFVGSYPRYGGATASQESAENDISFYLPERTLNRALSRGSRAKLPRIIHVYDVSKLFFIHKELAEKYIISLSDVAGTCARNAAAAATVGRLDLVQVWTLAGLAAAEDTEDGVPWRSHPFSVPNIDFLIQHYSKVSDIQTAAMLSCIFPEENKTKVESFKAPPMSSPYHTIHPADTSLEGWVVPLLKQPRSNSWSESAEEASVNTIVEHREALAGLTAYSSRKPRRRGLREDVKRRYADILHMWGLLETRTHVLKFVDDPVVVHSGLEFLLECQHCKKTVIGSASCPSCRHLALRCAVCRICVRGASNICLICGHGGHSTHMAAWFSTENVCPTGCGCKCAEETRHAIEL